MNTAMTPARDTPMDTTLGALSALLAPHLPHQLCGEGTQAVTRVHTDSRTLQPGDLFVALRGERFDGHDHIHEAFAAGASSVVSERALEDGQHGLIVADTRQALVALAKAWRMQFDLPVIAVTGSNGKTTVTQMVASILQAAYGDASLATRGNFNNDIGLPLTLLRLRAPHRAAVVEIGMNHTGEIAQLSQCALPTVALVNNAQREHQEFMHSVRAVAEENGQVIAALSAAGVAIFPADDEFSSVWQELARTRPCLRFGAGGELAVQGQWQGDHYAAQLSVANTLTRFKLHIAGAHNLRNAAAAAACAYAAGVSTTHIAAGLEAFRAVGGRSDVMSIRLAGKHITLVDDSYNANPDSVRAAIDVLASLPGPHALVLGDMGEVGDQGPKFHAEVGAYAASKSIEHVFLLGEATRATREACAQAQHFNHIDTLLAALQAVLPQLGSVLIKGSRFMKMERATQFLLAQAQHAA